jgi:hypothetical protein
VLPVFNTVLLNQRERVGKNTSSCLEANMVLSEIAFRLRWIPFKSDFHSLMLLRFCYYSKLQAAVRVAELVEP